ncbi:MAG: hypothetical protein IPK99_00145 [Flavobacteriales bacterium]|nr:hypothetical protein [Flavobacteriales bacterium]
MELSTKEVKEMEQNERSYTVYKNEDRFSFCPHEDLNLPKSYEEVLARFERLQGDKAWEVLN